MRSTRWVKILWQLGVDFPLATARSAKTLSGDSLLSWDSACIFDGSLPASLPFVNHCSTFYEGCLIIKDPHDAIVPSCSSVH